MTKRTQDEARLRGFLTLLGAALLAACGSGRPSEPARCEVWGIEIGTDIEVVANVISIVDGGGTGNLRLYAAGGRTKQWHELDAQGRIGPRLGFARTDHAQSFYPSWTHKVLAWDSGFRVVRDEFVEYVVANQPITTRQYTAAGPPLPAQIRVDFPTWIDGNLYVIWSGQESASIPPTYIAGLGMLDRDDRIVPMGAPFLRTNLTPNTSGFFLPGGGFDPDLRRFFVDHPDRKNVLEVALDGSLIGTYSIVGDAPYLRNWIKLPGGRFAGQHGGFFLMFTPTERWTDPARRDTVPGATISSSTQLMDRSNQLWIAGTGNKTLSVRRYDDATATLTEPAQSPLTVQDCDILLYLD